MNNRTTIIAIKLAYYAGGTNPTTLPHHSLHIVTYNHSIKQKKNKLAHQKAGHLSILIISH